MTEVPDFVPDEHHPVMVTEKEWKGIQKRGVADCPHEWSYRKGRPEGEFIIVYNNEVKRTSLPPGRVCQQCGKVEFRDRDRHHKYAPPWSQDDLTPPQ